MKKKTEFFDAHTHAQFAAFSEDWRSVIDRALGAGVRLINVGTQRDTSRRAVEIARQYPSGVYAAVGLHPVHTEKSYHDAKELGDTAAARGFTSRGEEFDDGYYRALAQNEKVVAIGECGLDYFRIKNNELGIEEAETTRQRQKDVFIKHIALAREAGKPLMIHCRDAFDDLIEILNSKFLIHNSRVPAVAHFFTGTKEHAQRLIEMGFYFTFGGVITFTRDYDEVIDMIPIDRILSETDAPYVAPAPYRGRRNEPAYVIEVVKKLAELKKKPLPEMADIVFGNAKRVFLI